MIYSYLPKLVDAKPRPRFELQPRNCGFQEPKAAKPVFCSSYKAAIRTAEATVQFVLRFEPKSIHFRGERLE